MPARKPIDLLSLDQLIRTRERVVSHREFREAGLAPSTVTYRIRPNGPWQRALPGVVITHRGTPTHRERALAAMRYGGEASVITGAAALRAHGITRGTDNRRVMLLVPHSSQRSSFDYVAVRRTRRMPTPKVIRGIPVAPVARALIDECREMQSLDDVRALVAHVLQQGRCTVQDIAREVFAGARQRTAISRVVLAEVSAGIRSVAEAKAREYYHKARVPQPIWNCAIETLDGDLLAIVDGLWAALMAALEIDSMRWHLGPEAYKRTQRRQRRLVTAGVLVLAVGPGDIIDDPDRFIAETRAFLAEAARRPAPTHLRAVEGRRDQAERARRQG